MCRRPAPTPSTRNGDAYAQDATTVTSAGPSTSLTNKTSSPRNASNRSPTTAFTEVQVSVDTSSTKMRGFEEVQPLTTLQLTGQCGRIQVGLFLHSPNLDHGPQDSWRSTHVSLPWSQALVLLLPIGDAGLGCYDRRGGGEE